MIDTSVHYVTRTPQGGFRIDGSRVSLDSVVHAYLSGASAEGIVEFLPSLSLEQVHGALAFYLHNREEIDKHLDEQDARWETLRNQSEARHRPLLERVRAAARLRRESAES
jgi:uncharacterized protein (DUF433 family)